MKTEKIRYKGGERWVDTGRGRDKIRHGERKTEKEQQIER
jgi:hypothetical protein